MEPRVLHMPAEHFCPTNAAILNRHSPRTLYKYISSKVVQRLSSTFHCRFHRILHLSCLQYYPARGDDVYISHDPHMSRDRCSSVLYGLFHHFLLDARAWSWKKTVLKVRKAFGAFCGNIKGLSRPSGLRSGFQQSAYRWRAVWDWQLTWVKYPLKLGSKQNTLNDSIEFAKALARQLFLFLMQASTNISEWCTSNLFVIHN